MGNIRNLLLIVVSGLILTTGLQRGLCQSCSGEGAPCSEDGALGTCCSTYTPEKGPDAGQTRKLKCSVDDPKTAGTCIDDGLVGEED